MAAETAHRPEKVVTTFRKAVTTILKAVTTFLKVVTTFLPSMLFDSDANAVSLSKINYMEVTLQNDKHSFFR